jgi:hypothetical protein
VMTAVTTEVITTTVPEVVRVYWVVEVWVWTEVSAAAELWEESKGEFCLSRERKGEERTSSHRRSWERSSSLCRLLLLLLL